MKPSKILPVLVLAASTLVSGVALADSERGSKHDESSSRAHAIKVESHADHGGKTRSGRGGPGGAAMFEKLFVQMDADKNGAVTQEEVDTFRAAQVQSADANGDGALNIQEFESLYRAFTHTRMVDVFQVLDDNGDGVISPDETDAKFGSLVKRMDRNGDGALSIEDRGRKGGHRG